ncbi:MAG: aldo/keto reductase [Firmicutes bacterium]|nr:aldo/keto reductase [Bacillota bacterium]
MSEYLGKDIFKLGFGLMRLPKNADGSTDIEQVKKMVDLFLAAGGTYFDTAYVYDMGRSEEAFRKAVVERYPRESFTLCTKINAWEQCHDEESCKQQFYTSLERTGAGYFDFYLLHGLMPNNYRKFDEYHIWDFVKEKKAAGLIKNYGFSFHGSAELLEQILYEHPDVDFIQLQLNYADWEDERIQSGACYEVARKHNKPITVMEPIKGGALANPIPSVQAIFKASRPDLSPASWAIRFVAGMDGIITVLSGMSNIAQMEDNLSYMKNFQPLSSEEHAVLKQAKAAIAAVDSIKCTGCRYCVEGCPMNIQIPNIFSARNTQLMYNDLNGAKRSYGFMTRNHGKASDCLQCGQCEAACPQHLPIITLLQECAAALE